MKQNHSQLVIILDRSGSMGSIRQSTIDAYNEFINTQKAVPGTADVMLAQFDSTYEILYNAALDKVPTLTTETFVPRGMTALHDAIGHSVDSVGKSIAALAEDQRPSKVIVAVFTDGGENASKDYLNKVGEIIKHQREKYGWEFNFFGANQDAVAVGQTYNIPQANSFSFNSDPTSVANTMRFASYSMAQTRGGITLNERQIKKARGITGQSVSMNFEDMQKTLNSVA